MSPFPHTAHRVTVRPARPDDEQALAYIAALDSARPLTGPTLVAERGDRVVAAIDMDGGRVIADPFVPSVGEVALLRMRRSREMRGGHGRGSVLRRTLVLRPGAAAWVA
jgi:hypothetical protein